MGLVNHDSKFVAVSGGSTSEVCFAAPDAGVRNISIPYWAVDAGAWVAIDTTFKDGMVCGTATTPGTYAMQGPTHLKAIHPWVEWCEDLNGDWTWNETWYWDMNGDGEVEEHHGGCYLP